mmetsp:Transcript_45357/g.125734  ORF Transcript_45357/g.125734 Transcript_45357/m.125734 type:complete len:204 (-) Transcript_45357:465-1076(-)
MVVAWRVLRAGKQQVDAVVAIGPSGAPSAPVVSWAQLVHVDAVGDVVERSVDLPTVAGAPLQLHLPPGVLVVQVGERALLERRGPAGRGRWRRGPESVERDELRGRVGVLHPGDAHARVALDLEDLAGAPRSSLARLVRGHLNSDAPLESREALALSLLRWRLERHLCGGGLCAARGGSLGGGRRLGRLEQGGPRVVGALDTP